MKIRIYPVLLAVLALLAVSCDAYLDKGPEENLSIPEAFAERAYAEQWLNNVYSGLPNEMNFHETYTVATFNPFVGGSDEMEVTAGWAVPNQINQASVSSVDDFMIWANSAEFCRKCNLFLENIHLTPLSPSDKEVWIGEAYFLRAMYQFMALRMYGPIPAWNVLYDINDDFTTIKRLPFDECVEMIVRDCEEACKRLPSFRDANNEGRATAAGAYALLARLLLYAASDLYNGNSDYTGIVNSDGAKMFPSYSRDRWVRAAEAAKKCIDYCEGRLAGSSAHYKLHEASSGDPVDSHYELFITNWNDEILFARNIGVNSKGFEKYMLSLQHGGLCTYGPTQQMIDSYRMANGEMTFVTDARGEVSYSASGQPTINPASGYLEAGFAVDDSPDGYWTANVSNMYVGREPRFYAHINFAGSVWKDKVNELWYSGADGLKRGEANYSKTGYLIRKFLERNSDVVTSRFSARSWVLFRLGEVYLNYAEALNEAYDQPQPDVLTYLNAIRRRGGLDELTGTYSRDQMRILIRQERRVELAFETHRFFDVRRWKIAEYTDNRAIHGLNINTGSSVDDAAFYQRILLENRKFYAPRNYLFPIEKSEIEKSPALIQNPEYN